MKDIHTWLSTPPPATEYNFLSLGAGVQSSCLALMAATGEVGPVPDAAIFADTQAEPASVYKWLDWLDAEIQRSPFPFPVHRVTRGSLTEVSLTIRERVRTVGAPWSKSLIPAFVANPNGSCGIMGRSCTADFKIAVLLKEERRLAQVKRGQKEVTATTWIGISYDEMQRMKVSREKWCQNRWPLIERRMRREDCLKWMADHGYPKPPRSSCVYCPFHSNAEWRRLRDEEPEEFARAVKFEQDLQDVKRRSDGMNGVPFLHNSLMPLGEVDLSDYQNDPRQMDMFQNECAGMCGV
jgi:hypothetical protein